MTQVVIRGESVYECDTCKRKIRIPTNRYGLDVMQRCNITAGCQGKLHRVTNLAEINSTPAFPPEVEGLQDWFARNIFYVHQQPVRTAQWVIHHNLQNVPVLNTFVYRTIDGIDTLVEFDPLTIETIDANTTIITFASAESGLVQCLSPASKNTVNYNGTAPTPPSTANVQLTTDSGEITFAVLSTAATVDITIVYLTSPPISIVYTGIDAIPSVNSPWVGAHGVIVNGKKYTVRSFSLTTSIGAIPYFAANLIPSGVAFYVDQVSNNPIGPNEALLLLSNEPHTAVDRIYNQYLDVGYINTTTPETFYGYGKGYAQPSIIKSTYPLILVV